MNNIIPLPSLDALKLKAKHLRAEMDARGRPISHSRSLEIQAHRHGYKNWNTLHAAIGNQRPSSPVVQGQQVSGEYLGQPFKGEDLAIQASTETGLYRATFRFEEAVDVVTFESFSAYRKQVSCHIDHDGKTVEKTSDGKPQLVLNL